MKLVECAGHFESRSKISWPLEIRSERTHKVERGMFIPFNKQQSRSAVQFL